MKTVHFLYLSLFILTMSCGQSTTTNEETGPSPISETDKQRYNLNPADQMHHETIQDSVMQDSILQDSLRVEE